MTAETKAERKRRLGRAAGARWRAKQPRERLREMSRRQNVKKTLTWATMTAEQRTKASAAQAKWVCKTPSWKMLSNARSRCKEQGLVCDLTLDDLAIPAICPVLGIPLARGKGKLHDGSPTLDKFIPELGYVRGNVTVISHRANRIKNDASLLELEAVTRWMRIRELI